MAQDASEIDIVNPDSGNGASGRQRESDTSTPRDDTPHGPTPRLPDGHVDLSGVWSGGGPVGDLEQGLAKGETIPLLPAAKAIMDEAAVEGRSGGELSADGHPTHRAISLANRPGFRPYLFLV